MPVEIEAKIKVDDLAAIRARLQSAGASLRGDFLETNVIFDTEDRSLLAADKGLRVRSARNTATGQEHCTLTFKGPRWPSDLKSREESEVGIDDFHRAIELLEKLKYLQVLCYEKKRQSWELAGCKVELDELPSLGTFIEIEGDGDKPIQHVQELLGLSGRPHIRTSYVGLVMSHLQERGASNRAVCFEKPRA